MIYNRRIFIVSGNHEQYKSWIRDMKNINKIYQADPHRSISLSDFVYLAGVEQFRGHNEVHGYFVGSFRDRPDIRDIVREIRRINNIPHNHQVIPDLFVGRGVSIL
jgi:hypothetical protein